jgi:hypothetical protein
VNYSAASGPDGIAVADLNGDGKLDLAVSNYGSNNVSVLLGNGDGTFQAAVNYSGASGPNGVAVADFNGDGKPDLVMPNFGATYSGLYLGDTSVSVLLGNGDGTFQAAASFPAGPGNPDAVAVGDFNADGKSDVVVSNYNSATVSVLLGNGDGTFQTGVNYAVGSGPIAVVVADVNGDGRPDLLVANPHSNNVSVLLGNGDGTFQTAVNYSTGLAPVSLAVGDFNGDGKLDLAVANCDGNTVSILRGNGDGTFQTAVSYSGSACPNSVAVGDLNGDGKLDLAVANFGDTTVSVLLGNGNGTFQAAVNYPAGSNPNSVAVGDFNGDGRPDLAVVDQEGVANVNILLGNGDGTFQTPVSYIADASPQYVVIGDFNGDGILDLATANGVACAFPSDPCTSSSNDISVLLGNGDGTFRSAVNYAAGFGVSDLALADFNGDGRVDFAVADAGDNSVTLLLNTTSSSQKHATSVAVASSLNPSTVGQSVTFTATVSSASGIPTGNVTFYDGTTVLGMGSLNTAGQAAFPTSSLSEGTHSITAVYGGDSNFATSTSTALTQTVNPASATNTTVASSLNPSTVGQSVTFTATVTSSAGTPSGTAKFLDGTTTLGSGTLNGAGVATYATSSLAVGAHSITASYTGNASFAPSTSTALTQTVNQTPTAGVPTISPGSESSTSPLTVTITPAASTTACYRTDGVIPKATVAGTCDTGSTSITTATMISLTIPGLVNAIGTKVGDANSAVVNATYTLVSSLCASYDLTCQNFETPGTGFDNGETWIQHNTAQTLNPTDSTSPAPLFGAQSLTIIGGGGNLDYGVYHNFTPTAHVVGFLAFHPITTVNGTANDTVFNIVDGSGNCLMCVFVYGSGGSEHLASYNASDRTISDSGQVVANGTTYYIWSEYAAGSGSNGTIKLWVSTTTTKPGSPQLSVTTSSSTASAAAIYLNSSYGTQWVEDGVLVCSIAKCPSGIGSNPIK